MNLEELNFKIDALTFESQQEEARYLRDERLGLCGLGPRDVPNAQIVEMVNAQLFPQ